eukprot:3665047-Amphidinium_carterae.4
MVIPALHNPNETIWDKSTRTRYTPSSQMIIGEVDDLSNEAPETSETIPSAYYAGNGWTSANAHAILYLVPNLREGKGTTQSPSQG